MPVTERFPNANNRTPRDIRTIYSPEIRARYRNRHREHIYGPVKFHIRQLWQALTDGDIKEIQDRILVIDMLDPDFISNEGLEELRNLI